MAVNNAAIVLLCIFALSSTLALRKPVKYTECEGATVTSKIASVDIEPYQQDKHGRYIFHKGTNVTTTIKFTPTEMFSGGTIHLSVDFLGQWKELPVPQPDVCKDHEMKCPLKPEVEYTMVGTLEVMKNLPSFPFTIQVDVQSSGTNKKYLFCYQMEIQIKS